MTTEEFLLKPGVGPAMDAIGTALKNAMTDRKVTGEGWVLELSGCWIATFARPDGRKYVCYLAWEPDFDLPERRWSVVGYDQADAADPRDKNVIAHFYNDAPGPKAISLMSPDQVALYARELALWAVASAHAMLFVPVPEVLRAYLRR